jgi:hypothetical protein
MTKRDTSKGSSHYRAVSNYRQNNVAKGLCMFCTNPLSPRSVSRCEEHLQASKERKQALRLLKTG